jgi:hypothetical protein
MQPTSIYRHPDNSIDYDFYRRQAARMRAEAMRDFVRRFRIGLLAAGTVGALAIAASSPAHRVYCPSCNGTSSSAIPASAAISMIAASTRAE